MIFASSREVPTWAGVEAEPASTPAGTWWTTVRRRVSVHNGSFSLGSLLALGRVIPGGFAVELWGDGLTCQDLDPALTGLVCRRGKVRLGRLVSRPLRTDSYLPWRTPPPAGEPSEAGRIVQVACGGVAATAPDATRGVEILPSVPASASTPRGALLFDGGYRTPYPNALTPTPQGAALLEESGFGTSFQGLAVLVDGEYIGWCEAGGWQHGVHHLFTLRDDRSYGDGSLDGHVSECLVAGGALDLAPEVLAVARRDPEGRIEIHAWLGEDKLTVGVAVGGDAAASPEWSYEYTLNAPLTPRDRLVDEASQVLLGRAGMTDLATLTFRAAVEDEDALRDVLGRADAAGVRSAMARALAGSLGRAPSYEDFLLQMNRTGLDPDLQSLCNGQCGPNCAEALATHHRCDERWRENEVLDDLVQSVIDQRRDVATRFLHLLRVPDEDRRTRAAWALLTDRWLQTRWWMRDEPRYDDDAMEALHTVLRAGTSDTAIIRAAMVAGECQDASPLLREDLVALLGHPSPEVREMAAGALVRQRWNVPAAEKILGDAPQATWVREWMTSEK